jgi:predicted RNA-binding protein associated with RNAse of E/G family
MWGVGLGVSKELIVLGEKAVDIVQGPFVAVEEQQLKSWQTMQQKSNYSIAQALQEAKVFEQYAIDVTESATQNSTSSTTLQHFF